ncbi:hypothetical protein IVA94_14730 [Bradyrhizobium sp. 156]|uniref:hypothetical protein n=1 Tax=Bradyrhizobium sp. 156 TaxID=2782630 RepID=UPI001FF8800A|nr:hypothetical protein [Bradyrhizobium sp. 156]MCK1322124.1 hypothetical protein [Bradyrhizobium sp. 156]
MKAYHVEHAPEVTVVDDGLIMLLWSQKLDTCEIAKRLHLKEWQVANRLLHIREALR